MKQMALAAVSASVFRFVALVGPLLIVLFAGLFFTAVSGGHRDTGNHDR
jgi:hypothetical protein